METYVFLIYFIVVLTLSLISLRNSFTVLSKRILFRKSLNLSLLTAVYFILIFCQSFLSVLYYLYMAILWRPNEVIYDARIMLLLGLSSSYFLFLHPILEIFLCIDRCITVTIPFGYTQQRRQRFAIFCFILIIAISLLLFIHIASINTFPSTSSTSCQIYYCLGFLLSQKYSMMVRITIASIGVVLCFALFFLLKRCIKNSSTTMIRKTSKTVLVMITATVILDFCPNFAGQIFSTVTKMNLLDSIGPYTLICGTLNIVLCSGIYYRTLTASTSSSVVTVS